MESRDKNLWIYNAGNAFSGNPKWMFLYMQKKHSEVKNVWLCYDRETMHYVRKLGYKAYLFCSQTGKKYMRRAGVYVVNQVKEVIYPELKGICMLNLWHGVGCKTVEQKVDFGFLQERIFKKYIKNNSFYRNNQLFLVTSPLMEEHFIKQCGLKKEQLVRANYPCCEEMEWVSCYDHDIKAKKNRDKDTKILMYCPTYRDGDALSFIGKAIPDMEELITALKEVNALLILKMHPQMEKDVQYNLYKEQYGDSPYVLFWDNRDDIYEIFEQIDTAIIDYSSIFYDLLARGVKNFIRYMFDMDEENNLRDFVFDVKEMTCGVMCEDFAELLKVIRQCFRQIDLSETKNKQPAKNDGDTGNKTAMSDINRVKDLFWSYKSHNSMEIIVKAAMEFEELKEEPKRLYSFDIFDTLIERKCHVPKGIFWYVQQKICMSDVKFPTIFMKEYADIRSGCEAQVRNWYHKNDKACKDLHFEITFDEIFERMKCVYNISEEQIQLLKEWELEGEYEACRPRTDMIEKIKQLMNGKDKVVLISDMYLPKEFVQKLLAKADPILREIPLFLSSEYKVQKTTKKLFLEVFSSFEPYDFSEWIHFGDNAFADGKMPKQLGIKTQNHKLSCMGEYENLLISKYENYDISRIATNMMRFEEQHKGDNRALFAYKHVALWLVPYVANVITDAMNKSIDCLYFISRDGHYLKKIADAIIKQRGLSIKTKYIYGSRKAWRTASFVKEVDADFYSEHGNLALIENFEQLLNGLELEEELFEQFFPNLLHLKKQGHIAKEQIKSICEVVKKSDEYKVYLLNKAKREREIVCDYLKQEIDFKEKYAFVEYWGRGYTQECFSRLLYVARFGEEYDTLYEKELPNVEFYYFRTIDFDDGKNIRYNFLNTNHSLIMVEAVFANHPYLSVTGYERKEEQGQIQIKPIRKENETFDKELFEDIDKYTVQFAKELYQDNIVDEEMLLKTLCLYGLNYYRSHKTDAIYLDTLAKLQDSVTINGTMHEFAPKISLKHVYMKLRYNEYIPTKSIEMSLARSNILLKTVQKSYTYLKKRRNK